MIPHLEQALDARKTLLERLHAEDTTCYRLFHGTNEGAPGVTIDRYGDQLLVQTFHAPLDIGVVEGLAASVSNVLGREFELVYNDRSQRNSRRTDDAVVEERELVCTELGVRYLVKGKHKGQDPLLFLDMRAGRRWMQANAAGKSVLNLFAYTCGIGVVAASAGASEVLNVDFAKRSLDVGRANAKLNGLSEATIEFFHSDFFTAAKQLAGIPIKSRARRGRTQTKKYPAIDEKKFDITFLDPPRWAKSSFGTVDLIRDYQSVLKPSVLATKDGGRLVCANNVAKVELSEWLDVITRCATKAGKSVRDVQVIEPESDFPSPDGRFPLKMAVLHL